MRFSFPAARRAGAMILTAALALGTAAQAADLTARQRQEDLEALYTVLERGHPDLFANAPEEAFLARKAEIEERLDTESEVEFLLDLQSLAALAGDSHTQVSLNAAAERMRFYPLALTW